MWGAYVHIPWCRYRCPYCAFAVDARKEPPHEAYRDALLREWELRRDFFQGPPDTVYFGGGTPSRSRPEVLAAVLRELGGASEITAEANPEDCSGALLEAWRDLGINRVSLGVQSFFEGSARRLGRRTGSRQAREAVRRAQDLGFQSLSVDLIFGGPSQTLQEWEQELEMAVALGVPHISLYGLTQEEGTAFGRLGEKLTVADEDLWRSMYDRAVERLEAAGIHRYEVSNFARDGHRSQHNQLYWRAEPWVGLGVGAHSFFPDGRRAANTSSVDDYLHLPEPQIQVDPPDHPLATWDFLWSMLRHVDGIDLARFQALTGKGIVPPAHLLSSGLLRRSPSHLALGSEGFAIADAIARLLYRDAMTVVDTSLTALPPPC